jgi:hypothetical protein
MPECPTIWKLTKSILKKSVIIGKYLIQEAVRKKTRTASCAMHGVINDFINQDQLVK